MTLTTTISRTSYPGTGSTGPFAIPFRIQTSADLLVVKRSAALVETTLALTTDYTVDAALANVTLIVALAAGETLMIRRAPALTQATSIRNQGPYFASTLEDELDRLVMQVQGLKDQLDRSFGVSETYDPALFNLRVPPGIAGQVLGWTDPAHLGAMTVSAGATTLPGQGRTVPTLSAYLANNAFFNVKDYGALGDGVTDDSAAVNSAINALAARGGILIFPPSINQYLLQNPINLTSTKTSKGVRVMGYGAGLGAGSAVQIQVKHAGVGFDCTGSSDITFENLALNGDSVTIPQTAFLLARDNSAGSAGRHRFLNCRTRGFWSAGAVWSYGSEENNYFGCYFYNEQLSGKAVVLTGSNRTDNTPAGLTSSFVTICVGVQTNLVHTFVGGSYWVLAGVTSDVFYLESAGSVNIIGIWTAAGVTGGAGRSLVYVDATFGFSNWVHITGMHGENVGSGLNQKYGVLFGNEAVRTHIGWSVRDTRVTVGATQRTGVAIGTTNLSPAITSAGLFTQTDVGAVIIGAGIPAGTRILSVTNANSATMNANATATGSPAVEIVFRMIFAPPNITLSNCRFEQNSEALTGGMQFSAAGTSIQDSVIQSNNLVVATVLDRCLVIGLSAFWTFTARTNSILIDTFTGFLDVSASVKVAGTKVLGGQQGGWATQTAVASKADLGAAPTVGQLAAWASAIDAMLKTHGLIS